jgi:hypothetical protein
MATEEQLFRMTSEITSEIRTSRQQKERDGPFFDQVAVFVVPAAAPVAVEMIQFGKTATSAVSADSCGASTIAGKLGVNKESLRQAPRKHLR